MVLVICEREEYLNPIVEKFSLKRINNYKNNIFYAGYMYDVKCVGLVCGLGMLNTAVAMCDILKSCVDDDISLVIDIGVCKGFSGGEPVGSVVVPEMYLCEPSVGCDFNPCGLELTGGNIISSSSELRDGEDLGCYIDRNSYIIKVFCNYFKKYMVSIKTVVDTEDAINVDMTLNILEKLFSKET